VSVLKWDGREFPLVEKPTFGEVAWVEKNAGRGWSDMGEALSSMACMLLTLRRGQVMLTWEDMLALSPADFDVDDEADADPTATGEEAGSTDSSPDETATG
jgi:hypothetical protein